MKVRYNYNSTHHWKCQLAKNKELLIPPIWDCCGPTEGSFFTHGQIKNPAFFEGRCYTGKMIRQMWAESAVCLNSYLWRGWIFYLSMGKKWTPSRSTRTPDRWYQKFFIFGQLALPMMCWDVLHENLLSQTFLALIMVNLFEFQKKNQLRLKRTYLDWFFQRNDMFHFSE